MKKTLLLTLCATVAAFAWQSQLNLDHLDRLSSKASETVNVTLDSSLLRMAAGFIDKDDEDAGDIKRLISGLKGIYIRSFEFKKSGEYLDSDVESVRSQLRDPQWKKIVQVHSKKDGDSDVYLRLDPGGKILGLTVISAEPKELTIVNIDGAIDMEGLKKLGGNFGIPKSIDKHLDDKKSEEKNK